MPAPIISDATEVVVHGTLFGQEVLHVWAVQTPPTPGSGDLDTICAIFQTAYVDIMAPLSNQYSINFIEAKYQGGPPATYGSLFISPAQEGGAAAVSSPGNVALCVALKSGFSGRRYNGRKYFSGIPEAATADNLIDTTLAANVLLGINDTLLPALESNGTPLGIISTVGEFLVMVDHAGVTDLFVDSMRRRLTGRGR